VYLFVELNNDNLLKDIDQTLQNILYKENIDRKLVLMWSLVYTMAKERMWVLDPLYKHRYLDREIARMNPMLKIDSINK
jgi:hypothetical protein